MGVLNCTSDYNNKIITLTPNRNVRKNIIVTGGEGFIGQELVKKLKEDPTNNIFVVDRKSGLEAKNIDFLIKYNTIDIIYHLAA